MKRLLLLLAILSTAATAHELRSEITSAQVTVITLRFADGKPFAYEQFEVRPQGSDTPTQVGRTDAQGRAAILPLPGKALDVVATSKDGHGARLSLAAGMPAPPSSGESASSSRWLQFLSGI